MYFAYNCGQKNEEYFYLFILFSVLGESVEAPVRPHVCRSENSLLPLCGIQASNSSRTRQKHLSPPELSSWPKETKVLRTIMEIMLRAPKWSKWGTSCWEGRWSGCDIIICFTIFTCCIYSFVLRIWRVYGPVLSVEDKLPLCVRNRTEFPLEWTRETLLWEYSKESVIPTWPCLGPNRSLPGKANFQFKWRIRKMKKRMTEEFTKNLNKEQRWSSFCLDNENKAHILC